MKWFGRIALVLLAVIGLLLGVGMLLPSGFKVQRSVEMAAAPDRSYPLIADPREWTRWSVWNRRDMGASPVNRYFGLFMDRLVGPDFEGGLKNLKSLVEG